MIDAVQAPEISGPVTKADVLAALGDTDPNKTNAGKIRAILGRGGNNTIQKFLDEIRASLVIPPPAPGTAPTAPGEAVAAIWAAAWSSAQAHTLGRLEAVTSQREALQSLSTTQASDIASYATELDEKNDDIEKLKRQLATTEVNLSASIHEQVLVNESLATDLTKIKAEHEIELLNLKSDFNHANELHSAEISKVTSEYEAKIQNIQHDVQHEKEIARQVESRMQIELSRLTDQIAELKSHLYKRIDAPEKAKPGRPKNLVSESNNDNDTEQLPLKD